jgi:hypothetical protein
MAFRKTRETAEYDQSVETDVEGEIREFVRRDVVTNAGRQPDNESQLMAHNINSVLQRVTATSVQEIDKLITELRVLSDRLHSEATRVQREIAQYSTLTEAALQSTKIIAESLEQWRKTPNTPTLSD